MRAQSGANASHAVIPTLASAVDEILRGGVRTRMLTEIAGESASGKSQLCCQLALSAQIVARWGGQEASVIYVNTEGPPPTRRLRALASSARFIHAFGNAQSASEALERIYIVNALGDGDALLEVLEALSAALRYAAQADAPVRLIVVDSVAAPFRDDDGGASANGGIHAKDSSWAYTIRRAGTLHKATMLLKEYATRHDLACVVTNHVVDSMRASDGASDGARALKSLGEVITSGRLVVPALGLAWGHCVNARCFVSRSAPRAGASVVHATDEDADEDASGVERTFRVVFAPHLGEASARFVLRDDGAWGVVRETSEPSRAPRARATSSEFIP